MASFSRSALMAGFRSMAARSEVLAPKFLNSTHIFSSPFSSASESIPQASRILSALGKVESLKPLHRLNAPARIKSKGFLVKTSPQICVVIRSFTRGLAENQSAVLKPVPPPKTTNPHPKITITLSSFERPYLEDQLPGRRIRLPETRRLYTVLRSPHVHKKSREQFEIRTKKQCLVIQTTEKDEWKRKFFWLKNGRAFL